VGITALGDRVSALTIPAVRGEHAGEYACVADNPAGSARHSAHLKVNGTEKNEEHTITKASSKTENKIKKYIYIYTYIFFDTKRNRAA